MTLTPEQLAAPNTEHAHQTAFFAWAATCQYRDRFKHLLFAIPNGGERDVIVAGRLKAEGVKAGVFDIALLIPCGNWHGLLIEMKKPKRRTEIGGGVSDAQRAFGLAVHGQGYATAVCYTWIEARDVIVRYVTDANGAIS